MLRWIRRRATGAGRDGARHRRGRRARARDERERRERALAREQGALAVILLREPE